MLNALGSGRSASSRPSSPSRLERISPTDSSADFALSIDVNPRSLQVLRANRETPFTLEASPPALDPSVSRTRRNGVHDEVERRWRPDAPEVEIFRSA